MSKIFSSKYGEFILNSKISVSKETKDYVGVILLDTWNFLSKKNTFPNPPTTPMYPPQMASGMPGYPSMHQYSYMRPPMPLVGNGEAGN